MSSAVTVDTPLADILSADELATLNTWLAKYPPERKRSAVMAALMIAQKNNGGYLTESLMNSVADHLGIPHVAAYEVATFYSMYQLEPVGEHVINVCTNISCMLRGSDKVMSHLENRLNIKVGETTADNKITLKEVECQGACAGAPMCEVDETFYEDLTPEKLDQIVDGILSKQGGE